MYVTIFLLYKLYVSLIVSNSLLLIEWDVLLKGAFSMTKIGILCFNFKLALSFKAGHIQIIASESFKYFFSKKLVNEIIMLFFEKL